MSVHDIEALIEADDRDEAPIDAQARQDRLDDYAPATGAEQVPEHVRRRYREMEPSHTSTPDRKAA